MGQNGETAPKRPNFLFILADDLGFSDIGCYGSEIQTPNIDRLASEGIRMLNHHAAAACSPTRAMLLSGTDAHLGGLGVLIEYKCSEQGAKRYGGKAGYEGYLNNDVATVPEILQDNGYFTAMSGKVRQSLKGGANEGKTNQPNVSGTWECALLKDHGSVALTKLSLCFLAAVTITAGSLFKKGSQTPNKTEDSDGFYSTDCYTERLIRYLRDRSDTEKSKPFFSFLPYTAPHWPLQCSREQRDKYHGMYDEGPYALRERRLKSLVELGIIDKSVVPHKVETEAMSVGEWDDLTETEKKLSSRAMEAYAGMVDSIDVNVGKVVEYLKESGEYDNTFIVFMSDNGAEGAAMEAVPVMGNKITQAIHQYYDNSYDNIGSWNSFTWLGPLWAQASTAPSRLFKCFPSQGGILVPCVVKPPKGAFLPSFTPGSISRSFSTVMDFAPTFLDLAQVSLPKAFQKNLVQVLGSGSATVSRNMMSFRNKDVHAIRGKSWVPYFCRGEKKENNDLWSIHSSTEPVGWELFARGALRKGDWKIVHFSKQHGGAGEGDDGWELFNVVKDPGETQNLAESEPGKLQELLAHWDEYVVECGIVWGESAVAPGADRDEAPGLWEDDVELQKVWMNTKGGQNPDSESTVV
ncbi:hypothetical protein F66182_1102 [Fusarium sp. NRRL 66182]|nr:hypothetical protein F66182_1102 [Fusarium sp. NRRL 66182]